MQMALKPSLLLLLIAWPVLAGDYYAKRASWADTMLSSRALLVAAKLQPRDRAKVADDVWLQIKKDFPVQWDWTLQDAGLSTGRWLISGGVVDIERKMIARATQELGPSGTEYLQALELLELQNVEASDRRWLDLYAQVCEKRREKRLQLLFATAPRLVFIKHRTIRPSFYAYTEGQSDAQNERHFLPGAELCLLEMNGLYGRTRTLVSDPSGAIRDPAVSWDGQRVTFAWKKSLDEDDYHLYELNVRSRRVRQITSGLGFADYEPAYLPNGDLIFSSTRCVQTVDCWWTEVSNLYTCDTEGRYLRRLGFDQVHSIYPQVLDDGRVVYTRWDYNDRGQIFPQPLFQMQPDGTGQTEFYGNNSWFPTTIAHARGIPGTGKVLAILCGHHSTQAGKLAVIDPGKGRQENHGVQLVAPVRETRAERIDSYGQDGELWQYPYALSENECVVTYAPLGWDRPPGREGDADFGIYWMDFAGRRELLAWDPRLPCSQPVPLVPRQPPLGVASHVDYSQKTGIYYVQDVYAGAALAGVSRGAIKKLRVVALDFRAAGVGHNGSSGPGGGALVCTPVAIGNGSWDAKIVLGEAKVYEDGSALFKVPARTPVYFQALDERGRAVQTMRSWSTLQQGETFSCVGCHEHKNSVPPTSGYGYSLAMKAGLQALDPFYGPARGFSYPKEIQPILDRNCIGCHKDRTAIQALTRGERTAPVLDRQRATGDTGKRDLAFSLLGEVVEDSGAKRKWSESYLTLTRSRGDQTENGLRAFYGDCSGPVVNWISSQSVPEPIPPYSGGSTRSSLLKMLEDGHRGVKLTREDLEKIACWIDLVVPFCGDYREANGWNEEEKSKYERFARKRREMEEIEQDSIRELTNGRVETRRPGRLMVPMR